MAFQEIFASQCIGDSLPIINGNFNNLDTSITELSSKFPLKSTDIDDNSISTSKIQDKAITNIKLRDSAGLSVIGRSANTVGTPADITASTNGFVLRRSNNTLSFGQIDNSSIANNAITTSKIVDLNITNDKIANNAITTSKIANNNITLEKLATLIQETLLPTGCIMAFGRGGTIPGWLYCNGGVVSKNSYPNLWNAIGTNFGPATSTTFTLPDLRGRFLRGHGGGSGSFGQVQQPYAGYNTFWVSYDDGDDRLGPRGEVNGMMVNGVVLKPNNDLGAAWRCGYGGPCHVEKNIETIPGDTRPVNIAINYYIKI